jgi:hypothetical protein
MFNIIGISTYFLINTAFCVSEMGDEDLYRRPVGIRAGWLLVVFFLGVPLALIQLFLMLVQYLKRNP